MGGCRWGEAGERDVGRGRMEGGERVGERVGIRVGRERVGVGAACAARVTAERVRGADQGRQGARGG